MKNGFSGIISMLINRRHKIRLLTELQFCPTSSKQSGVQSDSVFVLLFCSTLCQCYLSALARKRGKVARDLTSELASVVVGFKSNKGSQKESTA